MDDLRAFITSQPATTSVGMGYMRNATVQIVQNFTTDHDQAAKAVRLPVGSVGAYGSPYLSVIDLMKSWPGHPNRREVVMITDGIDRARRGPRARMAINPDVNSASDLAQRTGTMVHTIYAPGVGRLRRNYWEANNGQRAFPSCRTTLEASPSSWVFKTLLVSNPTSINCRRYLEINIYWGSLRYPATRTACKTSLLMNGVFRRTSSR